MTPADEADLVLGQLRQQGLVEDPVLPRYLLVDQLADPRQGLVRQQAVGAGLLAGEGDLLLQAGDADLEEFVEVAREDEEELQPLQERVGLVQRLFQHADVELQLGELAMNVQAAVIHTGNHRRWRFHRDRFGHLHFCFAFHVRHYGFVGGDTFDLIKSLLRIHSSSRGVNAPS